MEASRSDAIAPSRATTPGRHVEVVEGDSCCGVTHAVCLVSGRKGMKRPDLPLSVRACHQAMVQLGPSSGSLGSTTLRVSANVR